MTTTERTRGIRSPRRGGRTTGLGGFVTWVAVTTLAACSSAGDAGPTVTDPASPPSSPVATASATAPPSTTLPAVAPSVDSTVALDASAALASALDGLAAGYHFTTTVSVDGEVALTADGDRVGDGTRLTVTGAGGTVFYVITPDGTWVQPEDGEWEPLDTPPANADPIGSLRSPIEVKVDAVDAGVTRLTATVPATALGIPGPADAIAAVQLSIAAGELTRMSYSSPVEGRTATVEAGFGPIVDATPIVAPI